MAKPGIQLRTVYHMTPSAQGTRLTETTEIQALWLFRGFVRRQAEKAHRGMLENLRSYVERQARGPASDAHHER